MPTIIFLIHGHPCRIGPFLMNPLARRDGGIGIQPCCKLGEADKITRPACDIRIEDIHAILFDGIVPRHCASIHRFSGCPLRHSVCPGECSSQNTADSFQEPIRNPPAWSVCQYHRQGCLPPPSASDHTGLSPAPLFSRA